MKKFSLLLNYVKAMKPQIVLLAFYFLAAGTLGIPIPMMQKHIIDSIIPQGDSLQLFLVVGFITALMLCNFGFGYLKSQLSIKIRQTLITRLRIDIYEQLQKKNLIFLKKNQSGSLLARVLNDAGLVEHLSVDQFLSVSVAVIKVTVIAVILLRMNVLLSLLSLSVLPGIIAVFRKYRFKLYTRSKKLQESYARVSGKIRENIAAISMIQAENAEHRKGAETLQYCKDLENLSVEKGITGSRGSIWISLLSNVPLFGIIWGLGGYMVMRGSFSLGALLAYYQYLFVIMGPISAFFDFGMNMQAGRAAMDRIAEILNDQFQVKDRKDARALHSPINELLLENVGLEIPDRHDDTRSVAILKNITLKIGAQETIAVAGLNGSGKTTLMQVLLRQHDFTEGSIRLNGEDIRHYRIRDIRDRIAYLSQEQFFFNDTIRNNLTLGRNTGDCTIQEALRVADAYEFVTGLEHGLNTVVSEQGLTLSGGERQRLVLARAFLKKPDIYILDEPFTFIDTESEHRLIRSIKRIMADTTTIIISHKPALVALAGRVVVLSNGTVAEAGAPEELLLRRGALYKLFGAQAGEIR